MLFNQPLHRGNGASASVRTGPASSCGTSPEPGRRQITLNDHEDPDAVVEASTSRLAGQEPSA